MNLTHAAQILIVLALVILTIRHGGQLALWFRELWPDCSKEGSGDVREASK